MLTDHFAIHYDDQSRHGGRPRVHHPAAGDRHRRLGRARVRPCTGAGATRRRRPAPAASIDINVAALRASSVAWTMFDAAVEPCTHRRCPPTAQPAAAQPAARNRRQRRRNDRARQRPRAQRPPGGARRLQPLRVRHLEREPAPVANNYYWLQQAAAEWAAFRVESFLTPDAVRRSARPTTRATASAATAATDRLRPRRRSRLDVHGVPERAVRAGHREGVLHRRRAVGRPAAAGDAVRLGRARDTRARRSRACSPTTRSRG